MKSDSLKALRRSMLRTTSASAVACGCRPQTTEASRERMRSYYHAIQHAGLHMGLLVMDIDPATRKPTLFMTTPEQRAALAALR